ncbi:guanylate kinase [Cupriavidus metallidurans]|jgi:guanylate kinase|uniref:Guanylate kinase n=1 Tax=Cupriavidus metallidurans (strain ATCC 43123 / DSM 2839 / NBRC 102507 / CH34) TaxID=266264 RepID=KGUA_CUPMC|nr:guanylate kinase [Cupriavidus metallidurans]Q1LQ34.1 RecName: Full=Guanylate kinase; AltName: Full=GMP kinase [Cupriavidus metallidurans CH34]ABF07742.1 guanylate kinase [Cupriavidus metallidurans CH34]AVA33040.1 guanylate kinase [Cupriavidus metallidurans]MDE4917170.1 guanylate kinase [Cupriavidus metallidurans]QGS27956.1 guanylate kinase [Cupriavidus metallidurans]UBM11883.1 guanylate kinase [Cupriavidus metallidurans]
MSETTHTAIDTAYPGNLFMVVAPSGAGKSTLVNALLAQDKAIRLSISHTTRSPRPGEQNGREYHFISVDEFRAARDRGEFLEWAEVHGNYYATSRVWIEEQMAQGTDVLLEIDWQGAQQVHKRFSNAVEIFILPPSLTALEERLKKRGQDEPNVIVRRLLAAGSEMSHASESDYVIINEVFDDALKQLQNVVHATRLRFSSQKARHAELFIELGIH